MSEDMIKEKVFEIARKKDAVEKELKKLTKLKEEKLCAFEEDIWSAEVQHLYNGEAWNEHRMGCHCRITSVYFDNENDIRFCKDIDICIQDLSEELHKLEQLLEKAYDDFIQNETGDHKWIFEQPFVKELVLKFQLSETEIE